MGEISPRLYLKTRNFRAIILISSETTWSNEEMEVSYVEIEQHLGGFWDSKNFLGLMMIFAIFQTTDPRHFKIAQKVYF